MELRSWPPTQPEALGGDIGAVRSDLHFRNRRALAAETQGNQSPDTGHLGRTSGSTGYLNINGVQKSLKVTQRGLAPCQMWTGRGRAASRKHSQARMDDGFSHQNRTLGKRPGLGEDVRFLFRHMELLPLEQAEAAGSPGYKGTWGPRALAAAGAGDSSRGGAEGKAAPLRAPLRGPAYGRRSPERGVEGRKGGESWQAGTV